jgi:amino acid transporter
MATDTSLPQLGGATKLTLVDAIAQSVGFMGPVFSMAFLVPLIVGVTSATGLGAGNAAPVAVVIASVGVLGFGWIISEYARRISAAGSLYDYISDGFGPRVGAAFGFLYYAGVLGLGGALLVMLGGTIHDTLEGEFGQSILSEGGWDILLLVVTAALLYLGVALSTRVQLVLALVSIAAVLLFSLYVIIQVGGKNSLTTAVIPDADHGFKGVLFGVLYGVLLFTGFETAANLGEETAHPKRDIPRAILISVLAVGGFYVLVTYAQVAGYGFNLEALGKNAAGPLFGLAGPADTGGFGSDAVRRLLEIMIMLDMLAVLIGVSVAASRGLFALARDARLPAPLGKVSSRSTPMTASILVLALYALLVLVTLFVPSFVALPDLPHYVSVFAWFSTLGGFALSVIYLVICLGSLRGLKGHVPENRLYTAAGIGIIITGLAVFGGIYQVPAPANAAWMTAIVILAVGAALTFVFPGRPAPKDPWQGLAASEHGPTKL